MWDTVPRLPWNPVENWRSTSRHENQLFTYEVSQSMLKKGQNKVLEIYENSLGLPFIRRWETHISRFRDIGDNADEPAISTPPESAE